MILGMELQVSGSRGSSDLTEAASATTGGVAVAGALCDTGGRNNRLDAGHLGQSEPVPAKR